MKCLRMIRMNQDIYGRSHPQGTCVLLEVSSLNSLVHYFQSIHNNDIFELKWVKLNKVQKKDTALIPNIETSPSFCYSFVIRNSQN